jgi:2-polyprenyl-3-methyl-5-hydroxy-6-metoxy-1,4-benzoquinol methylase
MKKLVRSFLEKHKMVSLTLLKYTFKLYGKMYIWSTVFASCYEGEGKHPKHDIIKYREWFSGQLQPDWVLLDVGCNNGHMVEFLSEHCRFVYGIEMSEEMVREARRVRMRDNVEYICGDATTHDYKGVRAINCITLSNVLEHIEYRCEFLHKLINNVSWSGAEKLFLIRVPLVERDWLPVFAKSVGLDYRLDNTHYTEYTIEEFYQEMEKAGLMVLSYHIKFGELYAVCVTADSATRV